MPIPVVIFSRAWSSAGHVLAEYHKAAASVFRPAPHIVTNLVSGNTARKGFFHSEQPVGKPGKSACEGRGLFENYGQ